MVCDATAVVLTVKVADVFPTAMMTVVGGIAFLELLVSFTVIPPVGAGAVSVAVPVEETPPATVDGASVIDWMVGALTVREAVNDAPLKLAVIVALF